MVWLESLSSQLAIPMRLHSVSRATVGSFRIQASSHTWLCSQFPSHFLHLAAPTRVLTSQQRLWKWEIGEQVKVTQCCALPSLTQLSQAPVAVAAAFPTELITAARWTGGSCGKWQISWKQLPARFRAFSCQPSHRRVVLPQKLFRSAQLQPL